MKSIPTAKRYKKISEGIRKDISRNRYNAYKKVRGKCYSGTFDTVAEANLRPTRCKNRAIEVNFWRLVRAVSSKAPV